MTPFALAVLCVLPALAQAQVVSRPALYVRLLQGPSGYSTGDLVKNLDWTRKNLDGLLNYLEPDTLMSVATGEELASAQKDLLSESAACAALIADGDIALAKGIVRQKEDPPFHIRAVIYFPSRPSRVRINNPSMSLLQRDVASSQVNVAGHMATLISSKLEHAPAAEEEANIQGWLDSARKNLAASQKRLAQAREKEAGEGARQAGKKALGAGPSAPKDPSEPCVVEEGAALPANLRGPCYTK